MLTPRLPPLAHRRHLRRCLRRWHRLDVAPFLGLYALWAAWALELLWKEGGEKLMLVQLVTSLLLAVHVSFLGAVAATPRAAAAPWRPVLPAHDLLVVNPHTVSPPPTPYQSSTQALAFLSTVWSAELKARLHFVGAADLADATHVKVVPHTFVGTTEIVPLQGRVTVRRWRLSGHCLGCCC